MEILKKKSVRNNILVVLLALSIAAGFILRGIYLTADPPADISVSGGIIADPGQYAYNARHKVEFGQWSFAGYKVYCLSPVMHYLNYLNYKFFGINYTTHKLIPLIFSALTLLLLVFIVYRRFNPLHAFFTSVFFAFSYPVLIYSRFANREFPMIFFLLAAVYLFSEGARKHKTRYFVFSSIFFCLSFISKGSGAFLLSMFVGVGLLWVIEKKIKLRQVIYFTGIFVLFMVAWYFFIYLAHKEVMEPFLADNKSLRTLHSLPWVINNILTSKFMLALRSDPFVLFTASITVFLYIYWKLRKKKDIHPFVELSVAWVAIGAVFHGIVGYRPTRFFVALLVPASFLAGYLLDLIRRRQIKINVNIPMILSVIGSLIFFLFLGIIPYFKGSGDWPVKFYFIFFIFLLLATFFTKNKRFGNIVIIVTLLSSLSLNMVYFKKWADNREYGIVNTSNVLAKAIPPSRIAGNWASLLGTGTKHKTFFTWKRFINWHVDFLKKHKIDYMLLTKGKFADEIRDYKTLFKEEFSRAHLLAIFNIYQAEVHLYSLKPKEKSWRIESETLKTKEGKNGRVIFEENASGKMTVTLPYAKSGTSYVLYKIFPAGTWQKDGQFRIRAKGVFDFEIHTINSDRERMSRKKFSIDSPRSYSTIALPSVPIKNLTHVWIKISNLESDGFFDYLEIKPLEREG